MKIIFLFFFFFGILVSNASAEFNQNAFETAIINDNIEAINKIGKERGGEFEKEIKIAVSHFKKLNVHLDLAQSFITKNDLGRAASAIQDAIDSGVHYKSALSPFINGKKCKAHLNEIIQSLISLNELCNISKE